VKPLHDAQARVLQHLEGAGRHKGWLGALLVYLPDGTTFAVGTGFSDAERGEPPSVGSVITFRYQELSEGGVPRFPSYVGLRAESPDSPASKKGKVTMQPATSSTKRRFEFSEGNSNKFWEVAVDGSEVTVRFGRIGSQGKTNVKSLPDAAAARKQADKLIEEKTKKG